MPVAKPLGPRGVRVLERSGYGTLSEMFLFFQDGDMLVALGMKASSMLLTILWEHFTLLFVVCSVKN